MKAGTAIFWLGVFILAGLLGLGALLGGCQGCSGCSNVFKSTPTPAVPTSTASAPLPVPVAPPAPSYDPKPGPVLTPSEAANHPLCTETRAGKHNSRVYAVDTVLNAGRTLAARICTTSDFEAADLARVVDRTVYLTEGGHTASGTIDTWRKLSDSFPGKDSIDVKVGGKTVRMRNPYLVFIEDGDSFDFCSQYELKEKPKDLVDQKIWLECKLASPSWGGTPASQAHHQAVAQTVYAHRADLNAVSGDLEALKGRLEALDKRVTANGDRAVGKTTFDPNAP